MGVIPWEKRSRPGEADAIDRASPLRGQPSSPLGGLARHELSVSMEKGCHMEAVDVPAIGLAALLACHWVILLREVLAAPVPTLLACHGGLRYSAAPRCSHSPPAWPVLPRAFPVLKHGARHCSQPGLLQPVNKRDTLSSVWCFSESQCIGLLLTVRSHRHPLICKWVCPPHSPRVGSGTGSC